MLDKLKRLFFPPACAACGELLDPIRADVGGASECALCPVCLAEWKKRRAPRYANGFDSVSPTLAAGGCFEHISVISYKTGNFDGVPERLIYHLKHKGTGRAFCFAAKELSDIISQSCDLSVTENLLVAYTPRRKSAIRKDGFDQAKRLAEELSSSLGIPCTDVIERQSANTKEQKHLDSKERIENAEKAFALSDGADEICFGKTVLLVDDLLTTGATVGACSMLLLRAGARRVIAVSLARTESEVEAK